MAYLGEYDKRGDYYKSNRSEMLSFFPPSAKVVLDVGCSSGVFGSLVKEAFGAQVHGVEINGDLEEEAKQNIDRIFIGEIESVLGNLQDDTYDVIYLNDVLEHLVSPDAVLDGLKPKLKSNGVIIASIPNVRHHKVLRSLIFKRDFKYQESGVLDQTHLRFFTKKSMERLFLGRGFEILNVKGINPTKSWSPFFLNILSLGLFGWDTRFLQFVVVARKRV